MAVVNTYQVTKLTGSKVWVDDGKTHNNATEVILTVNYQRYDSAGNPVGEPGTVTDPVISWGTTEATKNNYEVGGLPVGDGKGNTYRYWAVETPITGYNTSCKNADDPDISGSDALGEEIWPTGISEKQRSLKRSARN